MPAKRISLPCAFGCLAAVAALAAVATDPRAAAAGAQTVTCEYVERGAPGPRDNYLEVRRSRTEGPVGVVITRAGNRISVRVSTKISCSGAAATVRSIDEILFLSDGTTLLTLDLRNGPLAPGASERGPGADIEFRIDTPTGGPQDRPTEFAVVVGKRSNQIALGSGPQAEVLNLNPRREKRDDRDVFIDSSWIHQLSGVRVSVGRGADSIDARGVGSSEPFQRMRAYLNGGPGPDRILGSPLVEVGELNGGSGRDRLVAGRLGDRLAGSAGSDVLTGAAGADSIRAGAGRDAIAARAGDDHLILRDSEVDEADCGTGVDGANADSIDRLRNCENVTRHGPGR